MMGRTQPHVDVRREQTGKWKEQVQQAKEESWHVKKYKDSQWDWTAVSKGRAWEAGEVL